MNTIASISTAPGVGGIGIIRISGENTFNIIKTIFVPKNEYNIDEIKGYTMKYGNIVDNSGKIIDEVLVSFFKKPNSYTTENMCEINSHGGSVVMKQILDLCIQNGAVMAEAGEFTKRAFLNGRIDLAQAESIIDILNAKTEKENEAAIKQLSGKLSTKIIDIRQKMMNIIVDIEVSIDYPEYDDLPEVTNKRLINDLTLINNDLNLLEESFETGKILRDGVKVSIIGKPNAR